MPRPVRRARGALFLSATFAAALATQGCTATIYRHRLTPVDGEIESSDPDGVNVRIHGRTYRIPAEQIDDIDHPGNVLMVIGAVCLAIGGTSVAVGANTGPSTRDALLPSGITYLGMGVGFMIGGGIPWASSRGAAMGYEYGAKRNKPTLPIDCAPVSGTDFSKCPEPPPQDTLPPQAR